MERADFLGCSRDMLTRNVDSLAKFCTRENWQSSVLFLSQELELFGLSSPCVRSPGASSEEPDKNGNLDIIALVNITWELLQNYRSCLRTIENLESHIRRMNNDVGHLQSSACRQRDLLEMSEREAFKNLEKEKKSSLQYKCSQQKLRLVKEEVRRLTNVLIQRESRYNHETKRKDKEISKLKERLVKILTEKAGKGHNNSSSVMGIELSSSIPKSDGKLRGRWSSEQSDNKRESELFKRIIQEFEAKNQNIVRENIHLRHFVSSMIDCFRLDGFQPLSPTSKLTESFINSVEARIRTEHEKGDDDYDCDSKKHEAESAAVLNRQWGELEQEKSEFEKIKKEFLTNLMRAQSPDTANLESPLLSPSKGQPQWSQGNVSYSVPQSDCKSSSASGINIGPTSSAYGPNTPSASRPSSRTTSRPNSRDGSASRTDTEVTPRKSSGVVRRNLNRPRSTNLSPVGGVANRNSVIGQSTTPRDGSLSPTSVQPGSYSRNSRSLPRIHHRQRRRSLFNRTSPSTESGSSTPTVPYKPPSGLEGTTSPTRDPYSDELSTHLAKLGEYIERKEQNNELSESEMEFHLENVRRAMNIANQRFYSSTEDV